MGQGASFAGAWRPQRLEILSLGCTDIPVMPACLACRGVQGLVILRVSALSSAELFGVQGRGSSLVRHEGPVFEFSASICKCRNTHPFGFEAKRQLCSALRFIEDM